MRFFSRGEQQSVTTMKVLHAKVRVRRVKEFLVEIARWMRSDIRSINGHRAPISTHEGTKTDVRQTLQTIWTYAGSKALSTKNTGKNRIFFAKYIWNNKWKYCQKVRNYRTLFGAKNTVAQRPEAAEHSWDYQRKGAGRGGTDEYAQPGNKITWKRGILSAL